MFDGVFDQILNDFYHARQVNMDRWHIGLNMDLCFEFTHGCFYAAQPRHDNFFIRYVFVWVFYTTNAE